MQQQFSTNFNQAIQAIKSAILQSRYKAAALANRELLSLYYGIGEFVSRKSREGTWGTGAIDQISNQLQQELPGLRGFSAANIKNMRLFYEAWCDILNRQLATDDLLRSNFEHITTRSSVSDDLHIKTDWLANASLLPTPNFTLIGFTHHNEIVKKTESLAERLFYIDRCATDFWSVEKLKYCLKENLFSQQGKLANNFAITISDADLRRKALLSFKDEYLLDYINIESPDEEFDERVLESEIMLNIKNFIMSLGKDFAFIGNQYRFIVEEQEYFVDLLFFNRQLQCMVAFELKRGAFKPEYIGKMNFYLSALDDLVRLPHENRSIGIILCKSKKEKIVEYAFRDTSKPMGVSTYKLATELPEKYRDILPDEEELRRLM
ncbi:MAG: PDDEXK nuclease domain-containing protein [Petrimonas sp.]|uniref:PDDEXK nuclease domain-containing protein n=1 Tax=Petrimonas sp. TaxID=2023866 RepID=UPI002B3BC555|nr:PDDEXK nuclease domain-containing protein [Petrimonas sp.]